MRIRQIGLHVVATLTAALAAAMLMAPAASDVDSRRPVHRYADYLRPSDAPAAEAVEDDQCARPVAEREGGWLCAGAAREEPARPS